MNTQFANFDIKSFLSTSDGERASVLGRQNNKSSNEKDSHQFSDQFAKAGIADEVEVEASEETNIPAAVIDEKIDLGAQTDRVSFTSISFELPTVGSPEKDNVLSNNIANGLPLKAEKEKVSEEQEMQSIRRPAGLNFAEWETGFTETSEISDNFSAVESAIAKYSGRKGGLEQTQKDPLSELIQSDDIELSVLPAQSSTTTSSAGLTESQEANPILQNNDAEAPVSTVSIQNNASYPLQQNEALAKTELPEIATNISVQSVENTVNYGIQDSQQKHAGLTKRFASPSSPETGTSSNNRAGVTAMPEDQGPSNAHMIVRASQAQKPLPLTPKNNDERISAREMKLTPAYLGGQKLQNDPLTVSVNKSVLGGLGMVDPVGIYMPSSSTEALGSSIDTDNLSDKILPRNGSLLLSNQANRFSNKAINKVDLVKQISAEVQPNDDASFEPVRPTVGFTKTIEVHKPVDQMKGLPMSKGGAVSKDQKIETDFRATSEDKPVDYTAETASPDVKNSVQKTSYLDSFNLRLANKIAIDRPAVKGTQEVDSAAEVIIEKQVVNNLESPVGVTDKIAQSLHPTHTLNQATATAAQKPVNFDWNSPKFAERFASEISDLNINGDLKKFEINPRNLGRLEVSFVARGTSEIVRIEAESQAARDVIVQHSQAIQDLLKAQGRSDLTIRVDLKDSSFASNSESNGQNLTQQDGAEAREDRSNAQSKSGSTLATELPLEPEARRDEGRYA